MVVEKQETNIGRILDEGFIPLQGDATDDDVSDFRQENERLKIALAESHIDVIKYKKSIGLR